MSKLLSWALVFMVFFTVLGCQANNPTPTLQPGEIEVPFETVVLDGEGWAEIAQDPQLYALTSIDDIGQLEEFLEPAALQRLQEVDFNTYHLLAFLRVPGRGCAGYGVTIDRLVRSANQLTVFATDWELREGACGETYASAYHIVRLRQADVNLVEVELVLESQVQETEEQTQKQL